MSDSVFVFRVVLAPIDQHWASMMISGPPRSLQIPVCVQSGYALWYGLFHLSPLRYVELQCSIVFHLLRIPVLFQLRRVCFPHGAQGGYALGYGPFRLRPLHYAKLQRNSIFHLL